MCGENSCPREGATMEERRDNIRQQPNFQLLLYDRTSGGCLGEVTNVSPEGMMITTSEPFPPKSEYHCKIPLPGNILLTEELLFDARSVWSRRIGETDRYQTGFELIHITPDERENIDLVVRELTIAGHWG